MKLEDVYDSNNAPGNRYLKNFMEGKPITMRQAVLAKCAECSNGFIDGKVDCYMDGICPLYPFMPYKNKVEYIGTVFPKPEKKKKKLSTEQLEKMQAGRRRK